VIIGEIGWPSEGRNRAGAVASVSNEALFLRRFLARAEKEGVRYYIMEAFDQPWKARDEGAVGSYWGIYDVDRHPKFEFTAPIVRIPEWHMLAAISVALALLMLGVFYMHSGSLRTRGRTLLAIVVYSARPATVWVIYDYTQQYLTPTSNAGRLAADPRHARGHRSAVRRGARVGRGALGRRARAPAGAQARR
jgi:hypothetical protein